MGDSAVTFSILIKQTEEYGFVAHCLELDLVATADTLEAVKADILDVIVAQIQYAFSNDNLEYLYHSAPPDVWREFYECRNQETERYQVPGSEENEKIEKFVPPWIIANTCRSTEDRHV
jgi:hypothetical protein